MIAVLKMRHIATGSRLDGMTIEKAKLGQYGYYHLIEPFEGAVVVRGMKGLMLEVVSPAKATSATDWAIEDDTNDDARLVSKCSGFSQGLFVLLCANISNEDDYLHGHDVAFEFATAADARTVCQQICQHRV